jgi:hypothetical protein
VSAAAAIAASPSLRTVSGSMSGQVYSCPPLHRSRIGIRFVAMAPLTATRSSRTG